MIKKGERKIKYVWLADNGAMLIESDIELIEILNELKIFCEVGMNINLKKLSFNLNL